MAADPQFSRRRQRRGRPDANMYGMTCTRPEVEAKWKRLSCVHPTVCKLLGTDHGPLVELLRRARTEPAVRKVLDASGVRMTWSSRSPEYMRELAEHHVGGHLKVAPEHTDPHVLGLMKKSRTATTSRASRRSSAGVARKVGRNSTSCRTTFPAIPDRIRTR